MGVLGIAATLDNNVTLLCDCIRRYGIFRLILHLLLYVRYRSKTAGLRRMIGSRWYTEARLCTLSSGLAPERRLPGDGSATRKVCALHCLRHRLFGQRCNTRCDANASDRCDIEFSKLIF